METKLSANQTKYILDLFRSDENFRNAFMKISGDIRADVVSFSNNPNCNCKKKVGKWIQTNSEQVIECFNQFKEKFDFKDEIPEKKLKPAAEKILKEGSLIKTENDGYKKSQGTVKHIQKEEIEEDEEIDKSRFGMKVAGEVVELDPNPESYKSLIGTAQKEMWIYKGLSVMETYKLVDGQETTVWLVFFY